MRTDDPHLLYGREREMNRGKREKGGKREVLSAANDI